MQSEKALACLDWKWGVHSETRCVALVRASGRGEAKLRGRARGDEGCEARARRDQLRPPVGRLVVVPVPAVCPISPVSLISPVSPNSL